ncbi:MAG: hypothetical protein ACLTSX_08160 [Collinsella sp.]
MIEEVLEQLSCRLLPVLNDMERGVYIIELDGGRRIDLPCDADEMFFSVTALRRARGRLFALRRLQRGHGPAFRHGGPQADQAGPCRPHHVDRRVARAPRPAMPGRVHG